MTAKSFPFTPMPPIPQGVFRPSTTPLPAHLLSVVLWAEAIAAKGTAAHEAHAASITRLA